MKFPNDIQRAVFLVKNTELTSYKIAKDTGLTEPTIFNYRNDVTKPTTANAKILIDYFNKNIDYKTLINNILKENQQILEKITEQNLFLKNIFVQL